MTNWVVPPGLRESMGPTIDHVAQQAGARKLSRALSLGDGFSFQLVVCNTPRVAAALQLWLADTVALERDPPVIERISPYPLDWRMARPERIGLDDLGESVLAKLVGERGDADRLVFIDAADADERDADAWRVAEALHRRDDGDVERPLGHHAIERGGHPIHQLCIDRHDPPVHRPIHGEAVDVGDPAEPHAAATSAWSNSRMAR